MADDPKILDELAQFQTAGAQELITEVLTQDGVSDQDRAARIAAQTIAFLTLCGLSDRTYAPSVEVDRGWHAFLLHTRAYAAFCDHVAGRFIHHEPTEPGAPQPAVGDTVAALRAHGLPVDDELWHSPGECGGSKCYSCTSGGAR